MRKEQLIELIEKYAPLHAQAQWDCSGVQIEASKDELQHLALMLDPTFDNIQEAIKLGADCVLAHHPLSFEPYKLNSDSILFKTISLLISHNILLYSAHTSLDVVCHDALCDTSVSINTGKYMSAWLAEDLQLRNLRELDEADHFGVIGELESAIKLEALVEQLEKSMPFVSRKDFRYICKDKLKARAREIKTIALCTGSGTSLYSHALKKKADIFITGDAKYHTALDIVQSDIGLSYEAPILLDVGHFALEEEMMRRFSVRLEKELPMKVTFIQGLNPFVPC